MARQVLKTDHTDFDTLYSGAGKINDNFEELYDAVSSLESTGIIQPDNVDFTYHSLLISSAFNECYYDIFREEGTVTLDGTPIPVHHLEDQYYSGYSGSQLYTEVVSAAPSGCSSFFVYIDTSEDFSYDVEYSINGTDWISCTASVSASDNIYTSEDYTELWLKFIWNGTGNLYSFGVLYDYMGFGFTSKTRFLTTYIAPSAIPSGTYLEVPEDNSYTFDGKSMDVFKNGLRLNEGIDYREINSTTIELLLNVEEDDVLTFSEQFGYVDSSDDNRSMILEEHDEGGLHKLKDQIFTSERFGLRLVGTEQLVVDPDTPTYTLSYTATYDVDGNVTEITETSSLGVKTTTYTYNIDGYVSTEVVDLDGATIKTTTYTYNVDNDLTSWSVVYNV